MRAAIYTRISEDDGTALGVQRQEEDARAEADERGWEVVGVYIDNDVSATRAKVRPEFERLIRDAHAGLFGAVLVYATDRLSREPREGEDLIDLHDKYGIEIRSLGGYYDLSTPDGRLNFRNEIARNKYETDKMSRRLKRKYKQNAEQGKPHGRAPYGMVRDGVRDVPDPRTAPVLRELAKRTLDGQSLRSIAADLTKRGVPAPGDWQRFTRLVKEGRAEDDALAEVTASPTGWNSTIIRQALIRPAYAGLRQHQGKVIGNSNGEAVFDRDIHDRLVALLTDPSRKQNHRGREPRYLLSGIARCGACGGTMRSQIGHQVKTDTGTKRQPPSYGCSKCFKVRRQREPVDALVHEVVLETLDDPRLLERLFVKGDAAAAAQAQDQLATIDAKLARNADLLDADEMTLEQFKRSNARLRDERATEQARLIAAAPNDQLAKFTGGDVVAIWKHASVLERREVIETLFDVVIEPQGPGRQFDPELVRVSLKATA